MTLTTLLIRIGIGAIIASLLTSFVFKQKKNIVISYLQNFCGILFIVSGFVKAVDPLGTAYKMEQYFTEFESTFSDTGLSFIAPLFPWLSQYVISFSVFMIVFEIVLGLMLIIGAKRKFTSWAFLILVLFFTVLTGFTYLTGYVPQGVNFFSFGSWGDYTATNMKVTDCGCFGDFIKLEPKTSFFKDVFLLVPAILFVWRYKDMHQIFNKITRYGLIAASTLGVLLYCFANFYWDIPGLDFRDFKNGKDVKTTKLIETEAEANVQVIAYELTHKENGKVVELPYAQYIANFKDYPKEDWKAEQIKTEPTVKKTKISDFEITTIDGDDATYEVFDNADYNFMIVSYKLYGEASRETRTIIDTLYKVDTLIREGDTTLVKKADGLQERTEKYINYEWDEDFINSYKNTILPIVNAAKSDNIKSNVVVGGAGEAMISSFTEALGQEVAVYTADDILLKTIVRSNPGIVLWKDGKIIKKWHYKKVPDYQEIKKAFIN